MTLWSFSFLSFFLRLSSGFLHAYTAEVAKSEIINVLEIIKEAFQIKVKKKCVTDASDWSLYYLI